MSIHKVTCWPGRVHCGCASAASSSAASKARRRQAEAAAWAGVHEIEVDAIADYVSLLTPLVLTADTRVTNHGFIDGIAVPRQAVLQVGTAMLVDEFGVPRVRCSSGSPLLPPEAVQGTTTYRGQAWDTFAPERTVAVAAAPEPQDEFVVFDVVTFDEDGKSSVFSRH